MNSANMIPTNNEQIESSEPVTTAWDTIGKEVPPPDELLFDRREQKLIRLINYNDPKHFEILNEVPKEEFDNIIRGIEEGIYNEAYMKDLIDSIQDQPEKVKQNYYDSARSLIEKVKTRKLHKLEISPGKSNEILQKTIIDGDIFTDSRGQDHELTPEKLREAGLAPRYEYKLAEMNIGVSEIFKVGNGRDAIIAYVEDKDGTFKTRSYYRSNSTGLWRYCGDYGREDAIHIWYGKGFGEDSLTLPFESQKALNSIPRKEDFKVKPPVNAYFLGTAKRYESDTDYYATKDSVQSKSELPGDYPKEVDYNPIKDLDIPDGKTPSEQIDSCTSAPDFRKEITSFKTNSSLYGNYTVRIFPSRDGKLFYSMCEVEEDGVRKAWVGNIEVNSPIGSTGLHKEWVNLGDLYLPPLYEYKEQAEEYGNINEEKNGYISTWDYLSKSPLIQRYLESTGNNSGKMV